MQSNKSRDTKPELALRSAVHSMGLRYRVDARPLKALRRRADLVFPRAKVAVFLDGCFWHGCPVHHTVAAANASFWAEKVSTNRARTPTPTRSWPTPAGSACGCGSTKIPPRRPSGCGPWCTNGGRDSAEDGLSG